jgi:hypothetical protein
VDRRAFDRFDWNIVGGIDYNDPFIGKSLSSMKKVDIWRWVERVIALSSIAYLLISNGELRATLKNTVEQIKQNDAKQDEYIDRQNEINGKWLMLYDYFIAPSAGAGTEEETEGN